MRVTFGRAEGRGRVSVRLRVTFGRVRRRVRGKG